MMYISLPSNNISRIDKNLKKRHTWLETRVSSPIAAADAVAAADAIAAGAIAGAGADCRCRCGWVVGGGVH